jgi:hypothetical protein
MEEEKVYVGGHMENDVTINSMGPAFNAYATDLMENLRNIELSLNGIADALERVADNIKS